MAMLADKPRRRVLARRTADGFLIASLAGFSGAVLLALGYIGFVLWPRWPEPAAAPDAPELPVVVANVIFNIPTAALRVPVQRHAGAQDRVDLAFAWPAEDSAAERTDASTPGPRPGDLLFVTIADAAGALAPDERLRTIYPRYTAEQPLAGPDGLTLVAFRDDTPYQGEDLVFDQAEEGHFVARCSRDAAVVHGTCLYERRIGGADFTVRFPRGWLPRWRAVATQIDRLIAQLRPTPS
jgi:hypothetical protein